MMYKAKVAVCSDIRTKHTTQSECHVEFLNIKPRWYVKKPLGFKRLNFSKIHPVGVALFDAKIRKNMTLLTVAFHDYFVNTIKKAYQRITVWEDIL